MVITSKAITKGDKKMKEGEIVENGLIAYCIIVLSVHTMLDIVMAEQQKEAKK